MAVQETVLSSTTKDPKHVLNRCISHAFVTQFMCFTGFYQSVMLQKRQCEQLDISLVSSKIQN